MFFEPNDLFSDFAPVQMGTVDDPNTVFSFHSYCISTAILASLSFGCDAYDTYLMVPAIFRPDRRPASPPRPSNTRTATRSA